MSNPKTIDYYEHYMLINYYQKLATKKQKKINELQAELYNCQAKLEVSQLDSNKYNEI